MNTKFWTGFIVAAVALLFALPSVSAFANFQYVEVDGTVFFNGASYAVEPNDVLNLNVVFNAIGNENDATVVARVLGEPGIFDITDEFDILAGRFYNKRLQLTMPKDIDPEEEFVLEITVESNSKQTVPFIVRLQAQRTSHSLEIISVSTDSRIEAGKNLALDVVVKNRGRKEAEDTFVEARIPELGVSKRVFLGDLAPVDQGGANLPDKFDSAQGRLSLLIPADATPGLYNIEIEAFNDDSITVVRKRLEVLGGSSTSTVVSSLTTKTFAVNEEASYTLTIVNSGSRIRVYTLIPESEGLSVRLDETTVAIPAGSSKTVRLTALATEEGNYNFKVGVHSIEGGLIQEQNFMAKVEGTKVADNATIVLTIVLAIIFIVLLIVLIVLLTRKPEKSENFGESYY